MTIVLSRKETICVWPSISLESMPREHSSTGIAIVTKPEDFERAAQKLFGLPLQQALSMWTYQVPQERTPTYDADRV